MLSETVAFFCVLRECYSTPQLILPFPPPLAPPLIFTPICQICISQQCHRLLKEMTQTVGKIYVYNIYEICENSQDRFGEDRARQVKSIL